MRLLRHAFLFALGTVLMVASGGQHKAEAAEPLPVVATFSILADMVRTIGGDRVGLTTLVGPDGDAHVFHPTPQHAEAVGKARLVFANGLGFEGWMDRLMEAAGFRGRVVTVTDGINVLEVGELEEHGHEHGRDEHPHEKDHGSSHGEEPHADAHGHTGDYEPENGNDHDHGDVDPHAWQDLGNAKIFVTNIAAALSDADPAGRRVYERNRDAYIAEIGTVERELRNALASLPGGPHRVVVPHHAFGYFERAYGLEFVAPQGLSTESEASAKDVARLIREIRSENVDAVFLENIADPRLIQQIERETDARIGGTLYSGALSDPNGPAATYLAMMRHNIRALAAALTR